MISFAVWSAGVALSLLIVGAGASYLAWHETEPDYAYIGALLVGASLVVFALAILGWAFS